VTLLVGLAGCGPDNPARRASNVPAETYPMPERSSSPNPPSADDERRKLDPTNVIIVLSDSLGAAHLSCYGFDHPTSPVLDAFAEDCFLFERCYAQAPWTKPSVASMLTGYLPSVHQAVLTFKKEGSDNFHAQILRERFVTLAECFGESGYVTAMFMMSMHCKKEDGFAQGFQDYHYKRFLDPAEQMDKVLAWLNENSDKPFFLFVHARDPHWGYKPPAACYRALYGDPPSLSETDRTIVERYRMVYKAWIHGNQSYNGIKLTDLSKEGLKYLRQCYNAEIYYVDQQFGRLLDGLKAHGIYGRTTVVFLADHGEEFREHGQIGHGRTLFNELLHVPLIIRPAGSAAGTRVPWTVSMFDVYPSVLALSGLPIPEGLQAQSLFGAGGELAVSEDRTVFSELDHLDQDLATWGMSVIRGKEKLILEHGRKTHKLFRLDRDPGEHAPLATAPGEILLEAVENQLRANETRANELGPAQWNDLNEEDKRALEATGYL